MKIYFIASLVLGVIGWGLLIFSVIRALRLRKQPRDYLLIQYQAEDGKIHTLINDEKNPIRWGILLADAVRTIALALERDKQKPQETCKTIQRVIDQEILHPSSPIDGRRNYPQ